VSPTARAASHRPGRRLGGFTLVEVLVAMVIMAIMAGMAWQGVDGIVRARNASQGRMELTLRLNTVMAQWERDLASIQDSAAVPMALSCDGASVRLTRLTPSGLQVVAWTLSPANGSAGGTWQRWAGAPATTTGALQDSWLRSLQLQGDEPGQVRTLTGISQWQVYFYQGNSWSNCQSTGNLVAAAPAASGASAAAPLRQALPKGVRIVLSFAEGSGLNGELTRDTQLGP
jgi:general secretion pathway protein J